MKLSVRSITTNLLALLFAMTVDALASDFKHAGGRRLQQESLLHKYRNAYKSTTVALQQSILTGNLDLAISILTVSKDPAELGAGMRFPPGDPEQYRIRTPERVTDPDVIAIKAIAGASLRLADCDWVSSSLDDPNTSNPQVLGILKLAKAFIIGITPENGVFPQGVNQFMLHVEILNMLADRSLMQQVLEDNPTASDLKRKLLVSNGEPVHTFECQFCYPGRFCRRATWWCGK